MIIIRRAANLGVLLVILLLFVCNNSFVRGACEVEADLDFESCDLKHLTDSALAVSSHLMSILFDTTCKCLNFNTINMFYLSSHTNKIQDICNRIGLDIVEHVLPYVLEEEESDDDNADENSSSNKDDTTITKTYTHEEYVLGAEECLNIEAEMIELEESDPNYLDQLERESLAEDPEIVAEIISDVLRQDEKLLKDIAEKLLKDAPDVVKEMEGMLGDEKLNTRPDVVGFVIATLLSVPDQDNAISILDEFDNALAKLFDGTEEIYDETQIGNGDEL